MNRKKVGEKLKVRRVQMNLTQDQLTVKTGLTRKQIIEMEKGTCNYGIDSFLKYTRATKIIIDFIPEGKSSVSSSSSLQMLLND